MNIWSGRGIFSILVLILAFILMFLILPDKSFSYVSIYSLYFTGVFSWVFGIKWNKKRFFFDEKTGKLFYTKNRHTLFWIPMQYWGIILLATGTIIMYQTTFWMILLFTIIPTGYFIYLFLLQDKEVQEKMVVIKEEVVPVIRETGKETCKKREEITPHKRFTLN